MMRRLASLAAVLAFICFAVAWSLKAHEAPSGWAYPYECCAGHDCAPVQASQVREGAHGWAVHVPAGSHPQVPANAAPVNAFVGYRDARPSPDGAFHICLSPADLRVLCFFAPPGGV